MIKSLLKISTALLIVTSLFFVNESGAQNVKKVEQELITMASSSDASIKSESHRLKALAYDIQPTVYLTNNMLNRKDGQSFPERIITDVRSINQLYNNSDLYSSIEIICVQLNTLEDFDFKININRLQNFTSLKYIYFLSSITICSSELNSNCEREKINSLIENNNLPHLKILYTSAVSE